ncbi:MAG: hypothetical protein K6G16_00530 [Lachnospiraceae bacterium]|nr:hypothetical protein [Lachnospiraceae bacterium]
MNVSYRQDTSYLFNSLSGGSTVNNSFGVSGLANLVSDYNTIKNGSYNKLVKAYYKKMGDDGSETTVTAASKKSTDSSDVLDRLLDKTPKKETEDQTTKASSKLYSQISSDAADVKKAVGALSEDVAVGNLYRERSITTKDAEGKETSSWGVDREAIGKAVSGFVDSYNALLKSASEADNSTVSSRASSLARLAGSFGSQLKEIGITYDEKGALSLDKDKLAAADTEKIRSVFNGVNSFGDRAESAATMLKSGATTAASSASTYSANATGSYNYNSVWNAQI